MQGESLLGLMNGQPTNGREDIYGEFHSHFYVCRQRLVRDRRYQFTFNESERGELYDFEKDPYQLHNVCYDPAYADVKKRLMDRMSHHMRELNDPAATWFERIRAFY